MSRGRVPLDPHVVGSVLLALLAPPMASCVNNPAESCMYHSECQQDGKSGVCAANGFCATECKEDRDCPCGSFCASGCGLCLTDDLAGPATCFAERWGLTPREVVTGACRGAAGRSPADANVPDASDAVCEGAQSAKVAMCGDAALPVPDEDGGDDATDGARR